MNDIYTLFFQHSNNLNGLMVDTVIFFGMLSLVGYIIRFATSLGRTRRF